MEKQLKAALFRGVVTGIIVGALVIFFLVVFGGRVYTEHAKLYDLIEAHTKQEDLRFARISNQLDQGVNERAHIVNNQAQILASQETLTARIIEMRSKGIDCKRDRELAVMQNMLIEHSITTNRK